MNHIARITSERNELQQLVRQTRDELAALERYLTSAKFTADDADYVHVRTDMLPKLTAIRFNLCGH